jgi:cysteine desulfurase
VHVLAGASSVHSVVRVTGNFTSESPLHPAAKEALLAAFDQGWADPKKISQSAARAAILRNQSLENIGNRLGLRPDAIEIIGEPALGHFLAIAGLLSPTKNFAYATIDKGKIRAIARAHSGPVQELEVDNEGQILKTTTLADDTVISLQLANGETGTIQNFRPHHKSQISVDATASGPRLPLPESWSTALFDAQSWNGPSGLGVLAINDSSYIYPLPRIAPIKSPGTYSLPLLIAAAIALENFSPEDPLIRSYLIDSLSEIEGVNIVAANSKALAHKISLSVEGLAGEQLVRALAKNGIDADSGSACSAADLQPSHVLAAMGYPTNGHLRLTLHSGTTRDDIDSLKRAISQAIS